VSSGAAHRVPARPSAIDRRESGRRQPVDRVADADSWPGAAPRRLVWIEESSMLYTIHERDFEWEFVDSPPDPGVVTATSQTSAVSLLSGVQGVDRTDESDLSCKHARIGPLLLNAARTHSQRRGFRDSQSNSSDRSLEKDAYNGIATGKNFTIRWSVKSRTELLNIKIRRLPTFRGGLIPLWECVRRCPDSTLHG
jgi:hypothetical protein